MSGKKKQNATEASFTPKEKEVMEQMGIEIPDDPQNLDWGNAFKRMREILAVVLGLLDKFGPILEQAQAAKEESDGE